MGKISLVSAKYIIHATITVEGTVDRPDIIGSVFGQTEGLLGNDLELRELQSSGRIGRIEVETSSKDGKTSGEIKIPSSMDKTETALIAAALETIERIGPCNAKVHVTKLEDIRAAKRGQVIDRAKLLLSGLTHGQDSPDSRDIKEKVSTGAKISDIETYGVDKLPCGPDVKDSKEILLVEGRADVVNLLRYDIKNAIAMNGTSVPKTIVDLAKKKDITVFLDGDRGGDLILKELSVVAKDIKFVARAPDGKEVEEITHKEIHQALRSKVKFKDAVDEVKKYPKESRLSERPQRDSRPSNRFERRDTRNSSQRDRPQSGRFERRDSRPSNRFERRGPGPRDYEDRSFRLPTVQKEIFSKFLDELKGSKEAYILDGKSNVLGKVPAKEVGSTIHDLGRLAYAVVVDGSLTKELLESAEEGRIKYLIGTKSLLKDTHSRVRVITKNDMK